MQICDLQLLIPADIYAAHGLSDAETAGLRRRWQANRRTKTYGNGRFQDEPLYNNPEVSPPRRDANRENNRRSARRQRSLNNSPRCIAAQWNIASTGSHVFQVFAWP